MRSELSKCLFAVILLSLASGCQTVDVFVNSIKSEDNLSKNTPMVFVKQNPDIESEKLRRQCTKGAAAAQIVVTENCDTDCYWVTIEGQTGPSKERTGSTYNSYTGQTSVSSYNVTDRRMKLTVYSESELENIIYQALLDSAGSSNNVIAVAEEMCEAAFRAFPDELTSKKFSITSRD